MCTSLQIGSVYHLGGTCALGSDLLPSDDPVHIPASCITVFRLPPAREGSGVKQNRSPSAARSNPSRRLWRLARSVFPEAQIPSLYIGTNAMRISCELQGVSYTESQCKTFFYNARFCKFSQSEFDYTLRCHTE